MNNKKRNINSFVEEVLKSFNPEKYKKKLEDNVEVCFMILIKRKQII